MKPGFHPTCVSRLHFVIHRRIQASRDGIVQKKAQLDRMQEIMTQAKVQVDKFKAKVDEPDPEKKVVPLVFIKHRWLAKRKVT